MGRTTSEQSTTLDDTTGTPRLLVAAPLVGAVLALVTGAGVAIAVAGLIRVPASQEFEARLVATPDAARVVSPRAGLVASLHVADGDLVSAGAPLVTLAGADVAELMRRLGEEAMRVRQRLDAARRDDAVAEVPGDRAHRIEALETELGGIRHRLASAERDMRDQTLTAPIGGRVHGLSRTRAAGRIAAGEVAAIVEPAPDRIVVEAVVPAALLDTVPAARHGSAVRAYAIGAASPRAPYAAWLADPSPPPTPHGEETPAARPVRFEVRDTQGALSRGRRPGDVVAAIAIDAVETKPIVNVLMARWGGWSGWSARPERAVASAARD